MSGPPPTKVYVCSHCTQDYETEAEARCCCEPAVWERWSCPVCGDYHEDEQEADDCCKDEKERLGPHWRPPLELEKHGQQRLF